MIYSCLKATLKNIGKNKQKFPIAMNTFNHPAAVYIFKPGRNDKPLSPSGVTTACSAGPTIKPNTCASDTIDTAPVLSFNLVESERYERHNVMLAAIKMSRVRIF